MLAYRDVLAQFHQLEQQVSTLRKPLPVSTLTQAILSEAEVMSHGVRALQAEKAKLADELLGMRFQLQVRVCCWWCCFCAVYHPPHESWFL